jgi:hypothetical protein
MAAPGRVSARGSRPKCTGTGLKVPCRPQSEADAPGPPKTAQNLHFPEVASGAHNGLGGVVPPRFFVKATDRQGVELPRTPGHLAGDRVADGHHPGRILRVKTDSGNFYRGAMSQLWNFSAMHLLPRTLIASSGIQTRRTSGSHTSTFYLHVRPRKFCRIRRG